ncbi:MAG: hypothetical protein EOO75_17115, partial [Myxococcales bacterium]
MNISGYEKGSSIELVKAAARGGLMRWSITHQGASLETRAWSDGKAPKVTTKALAADAISREYDKAVRTKMRDGYVFRRDREGARGDVMFAAFASGGGGGVVLDLSLDGRFLVTGGHSGAPNAVWLDVIDTVTAQRRTVFERKNASQVFLLSAQFDHTGEGVITSVDDETLRVDVATGQLRQLAKLGAARASFNTHVLRPQLDRARRRVVVFDEQVIVRVLDETGHTVLEVPMAHPTTECRAAGISPSGRLLALYRASRGVIYNHVDARHDATNVVDVWDIDAGRLRETVAIGPQLTGLGFDPRDELLVTSWHHERGPV